MDIDGLYYGHHVNNCKELLLYTDDYKQCKFFVLCADADMSDWIFSPCVETIKKPDYVDVVNMHENIDIFRMRHINWCLDDFVQNIRFYKVPIMKFLSYTREHDNWFMKFLSYATTCQKVDNMIKFPEPDTNLYTLDKRHIISSDYKYFKVQCPKCYYKYNGKTGRSNLIPAIIFVTIPLLLILAIIGGLVLLMIKLGHGP